MAGQIATASLENREDRSLIVPISMHLFRLLQYGIRSSGRPCVNHMDLFIYGTLVVACATMPIDQLKGLPRWAILIMGRFCSKATVRRGRWARYDEDEYHKKFSLFADKLIDAYFELL
jgi:hypothetical protein